MHALLVDACATYRVVLSENEAKQPVTVFKHEKKYSNSVLRFVLHVIFIHVLI